MSEHLDEKQVALLRAYQETFKHPAGRIVILDLLSKTRVLLPAFQPGDPHQTSWNDGRRSVGSDIIQNMSWSELELLHAVKEWTEPDYDPLAQALLDFDAPQEEIF